MFSKIYIPNVYSVYLSVFSANMLMLVTGTTLTWSSPSLPKLTNVTTSPFSSPVSSEQASWISSLVMMGAIAGPMIFGYLADKIGRKPTLLYLGIPFLFCFLALAFGSTVEMFYVARFICGIAVGGTFTILPIYISEIAEKTNRGTLTSSTGCFGCIGLLISCCVGPFASVKIFNLILAFFPVIYLVVFFCFAPESPHFLIKVEGSEPARTALKHLGRNHEAIENEMAELHAEFKEEDSTACIWDIFRVKGSRKAFLISLGLMIFQQFSGINAIVFYSQKIFQETSTNVPPEYCTIIIVTVQFLSSFLTPFIADRYGRRIILLISAVGMVISEAPLGTYCYLKHEHVNLEAFALAPIFSLASFIVFFNIGYGPLPWVLLCELFPSNVKSKATSIISTIVWLLSFIVTKYFDQAVIFFGLGQLFMFFAACCVFAGVFSMTYVVETKGKSFQEIQVMLNQ